MNKKQGDKTRDSREKKNYKEENEFITLLVNPSCTRVHGLHFKMG